MGVYCDLMNEENVIRTMIINLESLCTWHMLHDPRKRPPYFGRPLRRPLTHGRESVTLEEPRVLNQQVKVMSG